MRCRRLWVLVAGLALAGCAHRPPATAPTVTAPEASPAPNGGGAPHDTAHAAPSPAPPAAEPAPETPPPPVESVVSPDERRQALTRIVADTTAAGAAVRRCAGRRLLPDQESVFDTARNLLGQVRAALERDELWRAESLARKARQLASSLNCPG